MDALPENEALRAVLSPCGEPPRVDRSGVRAGQAAPAGAACVPSILHACGVLGTGTGSRSGRSQIEGG